MDIEKTVREAFVSRERAPDVEDVVMARLSAGAWRKSHSALRRPQRILLIGTLIAAVAAAAMLTARHSGSSLPAATYSRPPVTPSTQEALSDAPVIAPPPALVSVPVSAPGAGIVPPAGPAATDVAQLCNAAAAAPPAAPAFTVLVQPLQFETDDPVIQSWAREYYKALLDRLPRIPGLALVEEQAATTIAKPADFRVTVTVSNLDDKSIADRAAWRVTLMVHAWSGTGFDKGRGTAHQIRSLDINRCPLAGAPAAICGPAGEAVKDVDITLRTALPRFPTPAQAACERASQELFAQQRRADPTFDLSMIRQGLERLAATSVPATRNTVRQIQRNNLRPEMALPLVAAYHEATDAAFRNEVVTLLAVKYAGDPAARDVLAAVTGSGTDTLTRHVAERALSGDGRWRDYVMSRIRDARLPAEQRLEAWYWMVDVMPLDQQAMGATMADMLATLQKGDGIRVLVDLLAGTQKETGDSGDGLAVRQGQWALRQTGSLNHPAAPELLIACFDAVPNDGTLSVLATRRDDPRVASKLESIAAGDADPKLRRIAASYLRQPL